MSTSGAPPKRNIEKVAFSTFCDGFYRDKGETSRDSWFRLSYPRRRETETRECQRDTRAPGLRSTAPAPAPSSDLAPTGRHYSARLADAVPSSAREDVAGELKTASNTMRCASCSTRADFGVDEPVSLRSQCTEHGRSLRHCECKTAWDVPQRRAGTRGQRACQAHSSTHTRGGRARRA